MHVYHNKKKQMIIDDIDDNKIMVSKKEPYDKNNLLIQFFVYIDNDAIRPLCLKLSKMTVCINEFNNKNRNNNNNNNVSQGS